MQSALPPGAFVSRPKGVIGTLMGPGVLGEAGLSTGWPGSIDLMAR
jgi:hypothetical protein